MTRLRLFPPTAGRNPQPIASHAAHPKGHWTLAASLATLAGYTDASGFLKLGGLSVSFMSGNSTRLAVAAASLILSFLAGVVAGTVLAFAAGSRRKAAVLALAEARFPRGQGY